MSKRPRSIQFSRDEHPPAASIGLLALQHAALPALFLIYAAMIAKGAGFSTLEQQALMVGTLLSCGIGAVIQAAFPRQASGLLVMPIGSPMFVLFGIQAGILAGPGGVAALALMGGLTQIAMGRVLERMRAFFPAEVCGVVVLILGVSMLPGTLRRILGIEVGATVYALDSHALAISLATMGTIIAAAVWLKGTKRFFALLMGCAVGYLMAFFLGELDGFGKSIASASIIAPPQLVLPDFSVAISLEIAFVVLAIVSASDAMGVLISMDRLDDAEWSRPNMKQVSRGISALGATNVLSAFLGGSFVGLSSTNIGLAFATGVTSRVIGMIAGAVLIAASFFPKLTTIESAMPEPVVGGILGYAASYFIVAGAELALSRMMSPRRMIVIGVPVAAGIAVQATPVLVSSTTGVMNIILQSPLITSAVLAIALNALMRIGIAQTKAMDVPDGPSRYEKVLEALDLLGETWGLKRATVLQANGAVNQLIEAVSELSEGPLLLEAHHDELNFDLRILYSGQPMVFPDRAPSPEELMDDPDGVSRMAGWLVRHLAHQAQPFMRDGKQGVLLRFES
jgi:xanthine/uracil permease